MDYSRPDLADRLAAAYVSGVLRGAARRRMTQLLPAHPALQHAVRAWQERLMPLTLSVPPVRPPASVWRGVLRRIDGPTAPPEAATSVVIRWWQGVSFWRGLSALASVAAVSLSLLLARPEPSIPPMMVVLHATPDAASLAAAGEAPASWVASISSDGRTVVTQPLSPLSLKDDRVLELWAVPTAGSPRSLGLVSAKQTSVAQGLKLPEGTTALALSLEPLGGSPTGAPTGPVVFVGKLGT
jgi:anti-sigma-K factor RskA